MARIIDLSVIVSNKGSLRRKPEITYLKHKESAEYYSKFYGIKISDFQDGNYAATEKVNMGTHDTTHLDAPWHFWPTSEGKPAKTIDQVPLEWCYGDGVVLDFHTKKKGEVITPEEVKTSIQRIGYTLKPFDIVLIRTDTSKYYGEPDYENMHPGMSAEATLWLIQQGIKVMGIDAWGWDRPHDVMIKELREGKKGEFWKAHYLGKDYEYCHLERLTNLDKIPAPFGFKVAAFPIKIEEASGAWCRVVAILDD